MQTLVRPDRTTPPQQEARPASRETTVYLTVYLKPLSLEPPGLRRAQNNRPNEASSI